MHNNITCSFVFLCYISLYPSLQFQGENDKASLQLLVAWIFTITKAVFSLTPISEAIPCPFKQITKWIQSHNVQSHLKCLNVFFFFFGKMQFISSLQKREMVTSISCFNISNLHTQVYLMKNTGSCFQINQVFST